MSVSLFDLARPNQPKRRAVSVSRQTSVRRRGVHRAEKPSELADLRTRVLAARRQAARVIASW